MTAENDSYKTLATPAEALHKARNSKFYAFAYPVSSVEEVKPLLDALRKKFYDATHHCYAYRIGADGASVRANDDGEPSGTAGKPILGQLLSCGVTDCLVVVVRYFGGTKLGVPGLIDAYRQATASVLEVAEIVSRTVDSVFEVVFPYVNINDVMKIIKDIQPRVVSQNFDTICSMTLAIRQSLADRLTARLAAADGIQFTPKN